MSGRVSPPRLLFDENLAARLVNDTDRLYPGSAHVFELGLGGAPDALIWRTAADGGYVLATKDEDFHRMSVLYGPPPKVVWLRLGNCSSSQVATVLREEFDRICDFVDDQEAAFLALG